MFKIIKYYLLLTLISFAPVITTAQVKSIGIPHVKNYHKHDIDAGTQTWMIDVNNEGLIYFANNDGVLEFDGLSWRRHQMPDGVVVRSVKSSSDQKVYAGGFNQIGYFSYNESGFFSYISLNHLLKESERNFGEVWKIYELHYGIIFQSYEQIMIYNDNEIQVIKAPDLFHFSFLIESDVYINDQSHGLYRLAYDRLVKVPGTDKLNGQLIWSILPMGDNILIATANQGIYEFNGLKLNEWNNAAANFLKENQLYCGLAINEKEYAFGTIQNGLIIADTSGKILQHVNINRGLQNNTVLSAGLDPLGNIWLGLDRGIAYLEINSPLTYFSHFNSLSAAYACILHEGLLYVGTNRGLFYHNWKELQLQQGEDFALIPGTEGQVWNLMEVDGTLFCGHNSGVYVIDSVNAIQVSETQGGWTFIKPEGEDNILIGGTYNSLVKFERIDGVWKEGIDIKGFNESSRFLARAGEKRIWMSHGYLGVFRIHLNNKYDSVVKVEHYKSDQGLPSDRNINVMEVDDRVIFTTPQGFYRYDTRTNGFVPDDDFTSLFPKTDIVKLQLDNEGNIWYFTMEESGVFRLQEDGSFVDVTVPFRELEGKFINFFQFVYPLDDRNVFFGYEEGLVHYDQKYSKNYQRPLNVFIRKVELIGQDSAIFLGGDSPQIETSIPFKQNQLLFEYSASDSENPENLMFSTFLEGFDTEWTPWDNESKRELTNIGYGDMVFKVKAKNIFGAESNERSLQFKIEPPLYITWWAYTLYFVFLLLILYIISRYVSYRTFKSKQQVEERQKRLFEQREKQLQTETLEAEKEIIKLRNERLNAEMKLKDKELANNTMQMIQNSKSLISIKKELTKIGKQVSDENVRYHINLLIRRINRDIDTENQWKVFEEYFENVHDEFLNRLKSKYPDLSPREMKLCAYLRLNISSKEIATLMNISTRGVEISRYRLRKKLDLNHRTNLTEFIMSL